MAAFLMRYGHLVILTTSAKLYFVGGQLLFRALSSSVERFAATKRISLTDIFCEYDRLPPRDV